MSQCPVCSRKLKTDNPQKGDISWETTYCSHYCRLYDEQKLEQVPFAGGNKHHHWGIGITKAPLLSKQLQIFAAGGGFGPTTPCSKHTTNTTA